MGKKNMRYFTTRNSLEVTHLAYADDVIVFTQAKQSSLQQLIHCLQHYAAVSGQKINMEKSQFYIDERHASWAPNIEAVGGFKQGEFPFNYLGVPIFKGRKKTDMFMFLREKISARMHSWSHRTLSFGGRLTLIKSTLGAIPLHVFQVLEPTKGAMLQMESLFAKFFWGSFQERKATHWISWEQMCHPYNEGGVEIRRLEEMVEAFGMKLWVRFREQNSLWAKFMHRKYCQKSVPSKAPFNGNQSITWKRMARAGQKIHKELLWSLGDGEIYFWEDIWWKNRPLSDWCNPRMSLRQERVKDYWVNGSWDSSLLFGKLEPLGVPRGVIEEIVKIPIEAGGRDTLRWNRTTHGDFTTSSAWELCRHRHPHTPIFGLIWNNCILPSISIFVWRLLSNRLPVDTKLQWRKVSLASMCRCCKSPKVESREHLFIQGEVATEVWRKVATWFPNLPIWNERVTDLEARIRFWHRRLCQTDKLHISSVIPCIILWFIWSDRNSHIHRDVKMSAKNVVNKTKIYLQQLIKGGKVGRKEWEGCNNVENFDTSAWHVKPRKLIKMVKWIPPDTGWSKLNTKGVWNQSGSGAGGLLRDSNSDIVRGFVSKVNATSALHAELQALSLGLDMASGRSTKVWIELDSMEVIAMIQQKKPGPAYLRHQIVHIRNQIREIVTKFSHCNSVGNRAAEFAAKRGSLENEQHDFDRDTAPAMIKALARMDQLNMPNFSFRRH